MHGIPPARTVFPTPVGMNRPRVFRQIQRHCVPHTRGDEPLNNGDYTAPCTVFPTPVGMNRAPR